LLADPLSARDFEKASVTNAADDTHQNDPTFDYRVISDKLEGKGLNVSRRRVGRLCSDQRVWSSFVKKSRSGEKPGPPVHDDLVRRNFSAERLDQVWFIDITELPTSDGKVYLCSLRDASSLRLVGYSIGERTTADLAVSALRNANSLREPSGTIIHSNRGSPVEPSQFRSRAFVRVQKNNELIRSMGRVASAADIAATESFHALVQENVLNTRRWETKEDLRLAVVTWIEKKYHRQRRKEALGKMTPVALEALHRASQAA
jgi:putative transposase